MSYLCAPKHITFPEEKISAVIGGCRICSIFMITVCNKKRSCMSTNRYYSQKAQNQVQQHKLTTRWVKVKTVNTRKESLISTVLRQGRHLYRIKWKLFRFFEERRTIYLRQMNWTEFPLIDVRCKFYNNFVQVEVLQTKYLAPLDSTCNM